MRPTVRKLYALGYARYKLGEGGAANQWKAFFAAMEEAGHKLCPRQKAHVRKRFHAIAGDLSKDMPEVRTEFFGWLDGELDRIGAMQQAKREAERVG